MQLREIDKTRYSKHLKVVFAGMAVALMIIAVGASTLFIFLFSSPEVSHFSHNLAGVAAAAAIVFIVLNKFRQHPYMFEVVYVWDLKQQLNRIHRKLRKIEAAVEHNDNDAMIIMNFMYRGSKQLYELDDNTITMEGLVSKIRVLDQRMEDAGLSLSTDTYNPTMLDRF
ncbi:MAG: DUF3087 domain-containing protein [Gammaproteobacteria bacterium]|nr:DUF3087 domain-containing protein [Gammaproteobacteria bacterium]